LKDLYLAERRQEIVRFINDSGRVSVDELVEKFAVSAVTVRADLQALSERYLIVRTHGGAVSSGRGLHELSLAIRSQQKTVEKDHIGKASAVLIADDSAVIIDSSSTALAITRYLKHSHGLTILTNSVALAHEMLDAAGVTVAMPGGTIRRDMGSLTGGIGLEVFDQLNIQKGFFGAYGFSLPEGLTEASVAESEVKRKLVAMCREVIAVIDSTKWGRFGVTSFAAPALIHRVITDVHAPPDLVEQVRASGIQVDLV
jgi:DeoR family transcriptional regulator, aga operon transcriptional repressor